MCVCVLSSVEGAQHVVERGFFGTTQTYKTVDRGPDLPGEDVPDYLVCIFHTTFPPEGRWDFVLSIEVPDDLAADHAPTYDDIGEMLDPVTGELAGLSSDPFVSDEVWLTAEEANGYRDTLKVLDHDQEEVRPDLIGK